MTVLLAATLWLSGSLTNDAGTRAFRLYVPSTYAAGEARPLLLFIHGCTQTPEDFAGLSRIAELAERERILVLMPEQSAEANYSLCWNWFLPENQRRGSGEPSILHGMIDWTRERYNIDASRIYVAGVSSGGFMTSVMLSCYSDVFAAGMVASGGMFEAADDVYAGAAAALYGSPKDPDITGADAYRCAGSAHPRAVPVLVFHGDIDPYVAAVNADLTIAQFAQLNDLGDDGNDNDSIAARPLSTNTKTAPGRLRSTWKTFRFGAQCIVNGMGHAWSGGDPDFAYADTRGPDETAIMWEFLRKYTRSAPRRRAVR